MRYIGSKIRLLDNIEEVANRCVGAKTFCDIFSGTTSVARHFKKKYEVISNDLLYFSFVLQKATIENDQLPDFTKLREELKIEDVFDFLDNINTDKFVEKGFFYNNYSPNGGRMYITDENALRIDATRITVEEWYKKGLLSENEYFYLVACIVEGIPFVSNISGTYGAFHKTWDKRAFLKFKLERLKVITNNKSNSAYNLNGNDLVKQISGDILYIDPPYNNRQYLPNYHLLETAAKYDYPDIKGVTGIRSYSIEKSDFCIRSKVLNAFDSLLQEAKFKHIILSYNSEGLMKPIEIEEIMKNNGKPETFEMIEIPFTRFKSKKTTHNGLIHEYLFYIEKSI